MINLIPPTAKKQVKREYWVRVVSVWMILIAVVFLIVTALLVPVYVLVDSQLKAFAIEFSQASVQTESFNEDRETLVDANKTATLLSGGNETLMFTTLLEVLETLSGSQIDINNYSFSREGETISSISISGQAQTRQSLVAFSDALEENTLFEIAEIPISSLAKDSNIPFTINVIPADVIE